MNPSTNISFLSAFLISTITSAYCATTVLYENNFDDPVATLGPVTASVTGGTSSAGGISGGVTSGEGLSNINGFSGDLFRVTAPDDQLIIQVSGIDASNPVDLNFSLALIDSWDGSSAEFGTDIINVAVYDGGIGTTLIAGFSQVYQNSDDLANMPFVDSVIVSNMQLGFNNAAQFFNEDAFAIGFDDLQVSTGTLTFVIFGSSASNGGPGFQGGDDESFAIDNFVITSNVPEPSAFLLLGAAFFLGSFHRKRTV